MIIGIDSRPLSSNLTGIGIYLKNILDQLQEFDSVNDYILISNNKIHYKIVNPKWKKSYGKFELKFLSTFWMQIWAPIYVKKHNIDIFWGPRHHLPILVGRKIRTIVTVHDTVHLSCPKTMPLFHFIIDRMLMGVSVRMATKIIAVSNSTAADVVSYYKIDRKKVTTILHGSPLNSHNDTETFEKDHDFFLPANFFLVVGTLEPRKNIERIFKAFIITKRKYKDINLVFIGGMGWKTDRLLSRIKRRNEFPSIHFKGYASKKLLNHAYRKSLCLLFPSIYEGFGFPILEAMAHGTPVITSRVSSMPEVAGNAALLVDPYNAHDIADAMEKIITKNEIRNELIKKGYQNINRFSWTASSQKTLDTFYNNIS